MAKGMMETWQNNAGIKWQGHVVHAAYTDWFYLPEQPAEAQKPYRKRDVSTERQRETKS